MNLKNSVEPWGQEHIILFLLQDGVLFFFVNLGLLCGMGKFACTYCC